MFEFEVFRKQMYCIEESACDICLDFLAPPQSFGAPRSDSEPGKLCRPSLCPCDQINVSWFCKIVRKMEQLLWQTKTSFLNFRPKLDDCIFKVFSWHWKFLHEYYLSITLCNRCQNCSFCDSLCSNFFSCWNIASIQDSDFIAQMIR